MDSLTDPKKDPAVVNCLGNLGCCARCILRLIGVLLAEDEAAYRDPKQYLSQLVSIDQAECIDSILNESKKLKPNACPVCLDCFKQETIEKFVDCFGSLCIDDYKYKNFFFNISFPKCLAIRAHSMLLYLKKQFPSHQFGTLYEKKLGDSGKILEQAHKIFRVSAAEILAKALDKQYHPKSNLSLLITIGYEDDNTEVKNMRNLIKNKTTTKKNYIEISRNNLSEFLKDVDDDSFTKQFPVPPQIPDKPILLEKVDVTADPIYLGGRYMKFKRNVGQTPWIVDGVSLSEHNIQEIVFDAIFNVLRYRKEDMTFTASGREDVDVRMLGTGRPFYIKIDNPKQRQFTIEQLLEIERQVLKTELVAVIKLQIVYASELNRIKHGEENKTKTYRALCKTTAPNVKDAIALINKQGEVKITQLTCMRVLQRRTLMARDKIIHKMIAFEVAGHDNLFELEVVTQAGTYVKELVHGDFQRTKPNITSIIGHFTDLVALDCIDINLVWPEKV